MDQLASLSNHCILFIDRPGGGLIGALTAGVFSTLFKRIRGGFGVVGWVNGSFAWIHPDTFLLDWC